AKSGDPTLQAGIERPGVLDGLRGRIDDVGGGGRKGQAFVGGAGLKDHRMALGRAWDVQRPAHGEVLSSVVEDVQLLPVEISARSLATDEGVSVPAVPQSPHDGYEFARPFVAVGVIGIAVATEIAGLAISEGGDDIPAGAAAAQMVQRREFPSHMVWLVVG